MTSDLRARVDSLCVEAAALAAGLPEEDEACAIAARLASPLRVAVAGRVKAGKSTLLNALVGERLAPTDAGECTRLVTCYSEGVGYGVRAVLRDGERRDLQFDRDDGQLRISVDGLPMADVDRLEVSWPSAALRRSTLIDTPGLAGHDRSASLRTEQFLGVDGDDPSDADAVIYLMRHMHRRDAQFLESFLDRSLAHASPTNAVAVLSRADEIGAARLDALTSAARIAERYRHEPRVRSMCATVVPVAGLLAETAQTLVEAEVSLLREMVGAQERDEDMVVSVERFLSSPASASSAESRRRILHRFGMFGLRSSLAVLRRQRETSGPQLAAHLLALSGIGALRDVLDRHFVPRAEALKARSALQALHALATRLRQTRADEGERLEAAVEAMIGSAHELAELRLLHLVMTGEIELSESDVEEITRITGPGDATTRLGAEDDAEAADRALAGIGRWRTRAANPMADPLLSEACEIVARSYEGFYVAASQGVAGRAL